jgi:hypothetical protein
LFLSELFSDPSSNTSETESRTNKIGSMIKQSSGETTSEKNGNGENIRQSDRNSKISE